MDSKETEKGFSVPAELSSDVTVFRRARAIIGESIWWEAEGALRWCDITAGTIHRGFVDGDQRGRDDEVLSLSAPVSAFQPRASSSGFVFAGLDYVALADETGATERILTSIHHSNDHTRLNEGKCDPVGRFVVGSMDLEGEQDGAIYSVDESGDVRELVGGIAVANGFEWSNDGDTMWFTDTGTQTIYTAAYSETGELSDIRPFATGRASDGLTRDTTGGFWNGIYDTGHVVHWNADGEVDLEFDIPAGHVTSVALGGPDLSTLFIATASENLTEQQLDELPLTGSIFRVDTSTHGFPVRPFGTVTKGT
jgi:sugar lactone lactonase YvrE